MDHPCHKCGQAVEDGIPFCSHCGAPQIRVSIAQSPVVLSPNSDSASSSDAVGGPVPGSTSAVSFAMQWDHALPACAIAALAATLLMCLGLMVPFLAITGAGLLAVTLYRRRTSSSLLRPWTGAQLGALSGLFSFGMAAIFEAVAVAFFHAGAQIRGKVLEAIQQAASRTSDPQAQAIFDYFKSPPGMAVMMIFFVVFGLIAFIMLGGIGGALGGVFLGRRSRG